jgi:homopolymeric O-antigen transport system permease protein
MVSWVVGSLRRHRDLLSQLVMTDLRGRYVGSSLGLFWSVIHPLVMIVIYTVVFSRVMGNRLPDNQQPYAYGVYLCAALLPWIAFQEVVVRSTTLFPDHANLVRKIAFPKVILYGFVTLSSALNFVLAGAVFLAVLVVMGQLPPWTVVLWMPLVAVQLAFALGIGLITSVLHVFIRDTAQVVAVLMQVWFWLTPIVYVQAILPPWLQQAERLNPVHLFNETHRALLLQGRLPAVWPTAALLVVTACALTGGVAVYRRFRADMLDEL